MQIRDGQQISVFDLIKAQPEPADLEAALARRPLRRYRSSSGQRHSLLSPNSDFLQHPELFSYFTLLRNLLYLFFVAALVLIGPLVLNATSPSRYSGTLRAVSLGNYNVRLSNSILMQVFCFFFAWVLFIALHLQTAFSLSNYKRERSKPQIQDFTLFFRPEFDSPFCRKAAELAFCISGRMVREIVPAYSFHDDLPKLRRLLQIEKETVISSSDIKDKTKLRKKMRRLQNEKQHLLAGLSITEKGPKFEGMFVTFGRASQSQTVTEQFRGQCLLTGLQFAAARALIGCDVEEQYLDSKLLLEDSPTPAPRQIIWENLFVPRVQRVLRWFLNAAVLMVLFILVTFSFGMLMSYYPQQYNADCTGVQSIQLVTASNDTALRICYCISVQNASSLGLCSQVIEKVLPDAGLQAGIAVLACLANRLLVLAVLLLVQVLRPSFKSSLSLTASCLYAFAKYVTAVVLPCLPPWSFGEYNFADHGVFLLGLFNFNTHNLHKFSSFNSEWHLSYCYYVLTYVLVDLLAPLSKLLYAVCKTIYYRNRLETESQVGFTRQDLDHALSPFQFDLSLELGETMGLVAFAFSWAVSLPLVFALTFVNLLVRGVVAKYLLLNLSKRLDCGYDLQYFNRLLKGMTAIYLVGLPPTYLMLESLFDRAGTQTGIRQLALGLYLALWVGAWLCAVLLCWGVGGCRGGRVAGEEEVDPEWDGEGSYLLGESEEYGGVARLAQRLAG